MSRKLTMAFSVMIALLISTCSSDDGGIDQNLFGTWTQTSINLRDCANPNDNSTSPQSCDDEDCTQLILTDDLRYEMITLFRGQTQTERGQVRISETQMNFLPDNSTGNTIYNYSVTASGLTLSNVTIVCTEDFVYEK